LGWPIEGFHILFGADYGDEKRKGFRELAVALRHCWDDARFRQGMRGGHVRLAVFGRPSPELARLPIPISYCGYVNSEAVLAKMYAAANLYLLPSIEDNLPNTVLEAMSCGTPILAFSVGGVPDLVTDRLTGRLVPAGHSAALGTALLSILANTGECEAWSMNCRERVAREFSVELQTRRHLHLYESLGAQTTAPRTVASASEIPVNGDAGACLESSRRQLLLASLEHFTGTTKRLTSAHRALCDKFISHLREDCADPHAGSNSVRQRMLNELQSGLIAHEEERLARESEHRRRALARRELLAGLFGRKEGL
jgi:hypothetical protein